MPPSRLISPADLPGDPLRFLSERLDACRDRIARAAARAGRSARDVRLVAVTKYVDAGVIGLLYGLGLRDFGESRVQALAVKRQELVALGRSHLAVNPQGLVALPDAQFHLLGHLQRNKVRRALESCAVIQSVDSLRLLEEIERQAESSTGSLPDLYIEVNVSGEEQKTGLPERELTSLLEEASRRPAIAPMIRGLMGMAPAVSDPQEARPSFRRLRELRDAARRAELLPPDADLSMGMTDDFEAAIEEGAGTVRIGRLLYGEAMG